MVDPLRVRLTGPLASDGKGLWAYLLGQGYLPGTGCEHLRRLGHLSRWLGDSGLGAGQLSSERVAQFVAHKRDLGCRLFVSARGMEPVLSYLRGTGVVPPADPLVDSTPVGRLLRKYEAFLVRERGLVATTVRHYACVAGEFLAPSASIRGLGLRRLAAKDVTAFVLRDASSGRVGNRVSALRSFLGYAFAEGLVRYDLRGAVPAVAGWRLAGLPKALPPDVPKRLLRTCDRRTACGRQDFAVLLLMLRLALRAGEVAALQLGDVDWARAEVLIRGKGGRQDRLPLPHDVGQAIASYIQRSRPTTTSRMVFVQKRASHRDLTADAVKHIVRKAATKSGMSAFGAHRLRHTAATQMLRRGATLPQIAQALRHRSVDTTAIYAKVDRTALRGVARPWPETAK